MVILPENKHTAIKLKGQPGGRKEAGYAEQLDRKP
jgi:hypothetical protein